MSLLWKKISKWIFLWWRCQCKKTRIRKRNFRQRVGWFCLF